MGWQTDLFCNITFYKETYNDKDDVLYRIRELEKGIETAKQAITALALITEPKKFITEDYDPIAWMQNEVRENLELIEEYTIELYKLNLLLDYWDSCHNEEGLAINPPDDINWRTAYLDGDFVRTVKNPNSNSIL